VWSGSRAERVWTAHVPSPHKILAEALVESLRNMETGGVGGGFAGALRRPAHLNMPGFSLLVSYSRSLRTNRRLM
jgi:hypothetical protein